MSNPNPFADYMQCGQPFHTDASANTQCCGRKPGHVGPCWFYDVPADPVSPASSSRAQFTSGNRVVVLESSDLLGRTGIVTRVRVNGDVMVAVIDKDAVYSFAPRALAAVGDQPPDPTEPK